MIIQYPVPANYTMPGPVSLLAIRFQFSTCSHMSSIGGLVRLKLGNVIDRTVFRFEIFVLISGCQDTCHIFLYNAVKTTVKLSLDIVKYLDTSVARDTVIFFLSSSTFTGGTSIFIQRSHSQESTFAVASDWCILAVTCHSPKPPSRMVGLKDACMIDQAMRRTRLGAPFVRREAALASCGEE